MTPFYSDRQIVWLSDRSAVALKLKFVHWRTLRKAYRQMDIQFVSSFSTTVSVLQRKYSSYHCQTSQDHLQLTAHFQTSYRRSISLGFLATYCSTKSLRRVFRMSVKYSNLPCNATVSREATYALSLGENVRWLSRVWMNWGNRWNFIFLLKVSLGLWSCWRRWLP